MEMTNVKNAEKEGMAKEAETVKTAETAPAAEKPKVAEEPKAVETESAAEEPKTAEAAKEGETAYEAASVKEEPQKTGYRSELDGIEVDFELQYRDQETDMRDIAKRVAEDYAKRGNDASRIELIQVYLKPTDYTAYYVINNSYEGKIPLF